MKRKAKEIDRSAIPVVIPYKYVKRVQCDWDLESRTAFGLPYNLPGLDVRSPSLGVWSCMEWIDSPFPFSFSTCTLLDVAKVLYINEFRRQAATEILKYLQESTSDKERNETEFDVKVTEWVDQFSWKENPLGYAPIHTFFGYCWNGFGMLPPSKGGGDFATFGAVRAGVMISSVGKEMGVTWDELLWDTPLCLIGHVFTQKAGSEGVKHIARPYDMEHLKELEQDAIDRILAGRLLLWQEQEPLHTTWACLDDVQKKYGGVKLEKEFERLKKLKRQELGIKEPGK